MSDPGGLETRLRRLEDESAIRRLVMSYGPATDARVESGRIQRIHNEEIFAPVSCVPRVKSREEAMALIDAHEYGNGTCIVTRDGEAAYCFTDKIEATRFCGRAHPIEYDAKWMRRWTSIEAASRAPIS